MVVLLSIFAATWLGGYSFSIVKDPSIAGFPGLRSFNKPHIQNIKLEQLREYLSPLDKYLPAKTPLRYLGNKDENDLFSYIQAVLAPRRIGPDIGSNYIYVYSDSEEWIENRSELKKARLYYRLFNLGDIYVKDHKSDN